MTIKEPFINEDQNKLWRELVKKVEYLEAKIDRIENQLERKCGLEIF